jgi:hypothetical protein
MWDLIYGILSVNDAEESVCFSVCFALERRSLSSFDSVELDGDLTLEMRELGLTSVREESAQMPILKSLGLPLRGAADMGETGALSLAELPYAVGEGSIPLSTYPEEIEVVELSPSH